MVGEGMWPRHQVLGVIACHWVAAITLIFINKELMSFDHGDQDLTVFITLVQCMFSVATVFIAAAVKRYLNPRTPWLGIPLATFVHSDVLSMTFTFIGVVVMNNLLLKDIGVDFYQVARSSTLIFTVIFTRLFLGVALSVRIMFSCTLILLGFMVSVDQEMVLSSLSWVSVGYGVLASLSAALNGIFIKRADKQVRGNSLDLSLTNNVNSVMLLLPLALSTGQLQVAVTSDLVKMAAWWQLAVTGVLRLMVGWTTAKVISMTSPVTHHMSINAKSMVQTVMAVVLQGESKTLAWWLGNILVTLGVVNYGLSAAHRSQQGPSHVSAFRAMATAKVKGVLPQVRGVGRNNQVLRV